MRVKRGFKARRRRNRVLKLAKGFRGRRKNCFKRANQAVQRARDLARQNAAAAAKAAAKKDGATDDDDETSEKKDKVPALARETVKAPAEPG